MIRILFFFFSSRRRHTRYIGDWSSDVCSSDLLARSRRPRRRSQRTSPRSFAIASPRKPTRANSWPTRARVARSEERRVGKEGREQRAAEQGTEIIPYRASGETTEEE